MSEKIKVWAIVDPDGRIEKHTITPSNNHLIWQDSGRECCKHKFLAYEGVRFWLRFFWPTKTFDMYLKFGYTIKQFYLKEANHE